jgi:hypothetical protein
MSHQLQQLDHDALTRVTGGVFASASVQQGPAQAPQQPQSGGGEQRLHYHSGGAHVSISIRQG